MDNIFNAIDDLELIKDMLVRQPSFVDECHDKVPFAMAVARTGDIEKVRYVVEYSRAHMNIMDAEGRNMLHYGVMSGNLEVVRYLTERVGISPLDADLKGITPFDLAKDMADIKAFFEEYVGAAYEKLYKNPIRRGFYPDPSVVAVGEDYYMVNSSFMYCPAIPVSHSKDLINWEVIGYAITDDDLCMLDELSGGRGYWAPDISYHDGRFYICATYRLSDDGPVYRRQVVVSSEKPEGPYSKPVFIDEDGIDPSIFVDDDGKKYMLLNRGCRIFELSDDCTKQVSDARLLYYGDNKRGVEGVHLLKKDGYYYLFMAEGGTGIGHRISVARSKELFGFYEPCPYNPILKQEDGRKRLQKAGHGKPILGSDGNWYIVYLCARPMLSATGMVSMLGRETAIDKLIWTADGWPIAGDRRHPSDCAVVPKMCEGQVLKESFHDDFSGPLDLEWLSLRSRRNRVRISDNELILTSDKYEPNAIACRGVLLRRQSHDVFNCGISVYIKKDLKKAGLINYYDERSYVYAAVTFKEERAFLSIATYADGEEIKYEEELDVPFDSYVRIHEEVNGLERAFYLVKNDEKKFLTSIYVDFLCDEALKGGKRFTGAMVGVFGVGDGIENRFKDFDYNGLS